MPHELPNELEQADWLDRERAHHERIDTLIAGHRSRAARGHAHPVEDFLFTYYSFRPAQLRRWHAGAGVVLRGHAAQARENWHGYRAVPGGVMVDVASFLARRGPAVAHVQAVLAATRARPGQFGCFGLHEWAMVYRQHPAAVRHPAYSLRLGPAGTDAVVEAARIRCTHHDAFRFFSPAARPLNALQPRREDQLGLEQPGCLHATMDLYKWAYKLAPALPSELVADCFVLARRTRELDMRASPYDLSELGLSPVRIETPEGRAEYVTLQRSMAQQGQRLRQRLLGECRRLCAADRPAGESRANDPAGG